MNPMAAKPKPMSQIKQILRFTQQGKSIKFITRNLSISRNTVRKYLSLQKASGHSLEELLQLEDHALQQALIPERRSGIRACCKAWSSSCNSSSRECPLAFCSERYFRTVLREIERFLVINLIDLPCCVKRRICLI